MTYVVVIAVTLLAAATYLRVRKIRRDALRRRWQPLNESGDRLSPSFRLVQPNYQPSSSGIEVPRPRIDPTAHYVFGETVDDSASTLATYSHRDRALVRAGRRRRRSLGPLILGTLASLAVVVYLAS